MDYLTTIIVAPIFGILCCSLMFIREGRKHRNREQDYKPSEGLKGCIEATARLKEPKAGALITDEITGISNLRRGIKRVEYRDFPAMNDEYTLYEYNGNLKGAKA
jgi:hypothetical protein